MLLAKCLSCLTQWELINFSYFTLCIRVQGPYKLNIIEMLFGSSLLETFRVLPGGFWSIQAMQAVELY